jgi:hypothetical protein
METDTRIEELNLLWEPIRPYLVKQIAELYGRRHGAILEIGPFSGLIFGLAQRGVGQSFLMAAFPEAAIPTYQQEARKCGLENTIKIVKSDSSLIGIPDDSVDLAVFRGALFFPSLFQVDFRAIYRTLRAAGIGFVGGGFGKYTPAEIIQQVRERSERLNAAMGRVRITVETVRKQLRLSHLEKTCDITTEGGLWVVMKK